MKSLSWLLGLVLIVFTLQSRAQDSIRVLCVYGSVPAKGWEGKETIFKKKMFGRFIALHGGHVGVEAAPDMVLSFQPENYTGIFSSGHIFPRTKVANFDCCFDLMTDEDIWFLFPHYYPELDSVGHALFVIPINPAQRAALTVIVNRYLTYAKRPYDYAALGMRCASETYQVLQALGLATIYRHHLWRSIGSTRKFRYALYKEYLRHRGNAAGDWKLYVWKGCSSRVWEKDRIPLVP